MAETAMDRTQACASRTEALMTALDKLVIEADRFCVVTELRSPSLDSALLHARLVLSLVEALDDEPTQGQDNERT